MDTSTCVVHNRNLCEHCVVIEDDHYDHDDDDDGNSNLEKCRKWLDDVSITSGFESESDGLSEMTSTTENSAMDSGFTFGTDGIAVSHEIVLKRDADEKRNELVDLRDVLRKEPNNYDNIQIYKSKKVHIGDVTNINGPVYVNVNATSRFPVLSTDDFPVITRRNWLAQPPLETPLRLEGPAKFVIIIHSATEEAFTQADNTLMVRLIQCFHIESRKWADISYNFLVGADGCVFEGRGWGVEGAHSHKYNRYSIGICFIGCFMQHGPTPIAVERAKALIGHGIEKKQIAPDYKLLGHCQCCSTESPGRVLYKQIQSWDHWDGSISVGSPWSPLRDPQSP